MCLPCVNIFFFSSLFQQGHTIAHKYLVPAIMQLYIDIEFTGSHTQFYDKFNVRYYISKLMKFLWGMPVYKKSIQEQSEYVLFCRCCVVVLSLFCRCFVVVFVYVFLWMDYLLSIGIINSSFDLSICFSMTPHTYWMNHLRSCRRFEASNY